MRQEQKHILNEIDPPAYLKEAVFARVAKEREKQILRKKMLYLGGFSISTFGLLAAVGFFGRNIVASDFWSIVSLAFTDLKVVAMFWQEYALSLLETFPVEAFACICIPLLVLMILIKEYISQSNYNHPRIYRSATNLQIN